MSSARLDDRTVISVRGEDAGHFLQNLITTDVDALAKGEIMPGALLTPQGKILFDFLVSRDGDHFRLDCRADTASELAKRLMLYKLRAKVEILESDQRDIAVSWNSDSSPSSGLKDRRFPGGEVCRHYGGDLPAIDSDPAEWHAQRIANGVGESGDDYPLGDTFPHDALFDQNGGVSFKKGCFVGQEVVSRMQHRGTARRRLLMVNSVSMLPAPGTEITVGERKIGSLGSSAGSRGLAMVRIDRVAQALADGTALMAGDAEISLSIPDWAAFDFPDADAEAEETG